MLRKQQNHPDLCVYTLNEQAGVLPVPPEKLWRR